jgi:hypothetical protein
MKYVCLGYYSEESWNTMSDDEQSQLMEECFNYDDILRKNGHFIGGEALRESQTAKTLRYRNGKVIVTDGPYAETKEQLGGLILLEAESLDHAIELMSKHPGVRTGPFEIRPADEMCNKLISERTAAIKEEK